MSQKETGTNSVTRLVSALIISSLATVAFGGDVDLGAVSSLKVDLDQVVELGTVSAVDGVTSAGQPNAAALKVFADVGYVAIIDLRRPDEDRGFEQAAVVEDLGMHYVNLPIARHDDVSFENAGKLDELLKEFDGPVLVHCASANRVGALLALRQYLNGASVESALEYGKEAGLTRLEGTVRERLSEAAE
jgi:uncharacterized protein (TIGR01244 family)